MKRKWIKNLIVVLVIAAIGSGGYYAYRVHATSNVTQTVRYRNVIASKTNLSVAVPATGSVLSPTQQDILPTNSGTVTVYHKLGDTVKKGDLIAKIQNDSLQSQINKDQITLQQQNLALSKIKADDTTGLAQQQLTIQQTQDDLNSAEAQLEKCNIYSPIDGTIIAMNNVTGDSVQTGKAIATVVDMSQLQIDVSVDELDIAKVKTGQKVNISFDALPDQKFDGSVVKISDTGKTTNNVTTYDVYVSINNPSGIKLGMNANVNIDVNDKQDALVIPIEALVSRNGKKYVMVPTGASTSTQSSGNTQGQGNSQRRSQNGQGYGGNGNGQGWSGNGNSQGWSGSRSSNGQNQQRDFTLKEVQTGLTNDTYVEITGGLKEGDKVMIALPQTSSQNSSNSNRSGFGSSGFGGGMGGFGGGMGSGGRSGGSGSGRSGN
ncbi:MAG: efflux RND transporter periplasmic adaptor subunit [Bacillota bacterium]|nr:efflux RND transporter periplasmic adaptor subunit [Bacillota bacterium]